LREYAATLAWPDGQPPTLSERVWPAVCYTVKDWIDRSLGRDDETTRRAESRQHVRS
jgi:hypothetical protein